MLGWLNDCMEKLILHKYSTATWHSIKRVAGCTVPDGGFLHFNSYPDKDTKDLMTAASDELDMDLTLFLQIFGAFFAGYLQDQGFGTLLRGQGRTLKELLANVNDMHAHIQSTSPKPMTLPQFWVEDSPEEDGCLVLHYRSKRGNFLTPLVEGLVGEIATSLYNVEITMDRTATQGKKDADFTSWNVSASDPTEYWKLNSEVKGVISHPNNIPAAMCKCPFTGMAMTTTPASRSNQSLTSLVSNSNSKRSASDMSLNADSKVNANSESPSAHTCTVHDNGDGDDDGSVSSDTSSILDEDFKIGLSGDVTEKLFPYHVMINKDFLIGQVGKDLPGLLNIPDFDLIGQKLGDILMLKRPTGMVWDWKCIHLLEDQSFEVEPIHPQPEGQTSQLCFKTTIVHVSQSPSLVMLVLTPHAQTFQELSDMNLTISDLPLHGGYRDSVFLSEHLSSQMNNSLKVEKLTRNLDREKDLLESLLPTHAAEGLRKGKFIKPMLHKNVTFFFSDIVGFTTICSQLYPWQVIEMLNNLYCVMDLLAAKFNLFKVETIGDAYVCCSGLPYADPAHARNVANFAVAVSHCVKQVFSPVDNTPIQLRIGIHTGKSASGVVGVTNPRYCVFGDTVNTTARHESSGMAGRVHCSGVTQAELTKNYEGCFNLEERGLVEMKGKGKLTTFWLAGTEANDSLNKDALAKLDAEVKDLLVKADFKINIDTMEKGEATLCEDASKSKARQEMPKPKREFRLPSRTSVVRCSVPSMHDVRRIGSIMRRIKNGGDGPASNFLWTKKKRMPARKTKSMGDYEPPQKRKIGRLSDNAAVRIAGRLAPNPKKQRGLNIPIQEFVSNGFLAAAGGEGARSPSHSPLGFQAKMGAEHRSGLARPTLSDASLTRMSAQVSQHGNMGDAELEYTTVTSVEKAQLNRAMCIAAIQRARKVIPQSSNDPAN